MEEYFEGIIQYQYKYAWKDRLQTRQCYYKNGNYLSINIHKDRKKSHVNHLYTHHNQQYHKINHRLKTVLYRKREIFNQKVDKVKNLGKENITGFKCHKIKVHFINFLEGDQETWPSEGTFWYCPQLLIDPQYYLKHQNFYYQSRPDILEPFCFALRWIATDRFGGTEEVIAQEITLQNIDNQHFDINELDQYELIDWNEKDLLDAEARQRSMAEFLLKQEIALEKTVLEFYKRPLTEQERNNSTQALLHIIENISPSDQTRFVQMFLRNSLS